MKDLIIPTKQDNAINISEINEDFSGLIIAYQKDLPIGYIQYVSGDWNFYMAINGDDNIENSMVSLLDLIYTIKSKYSNINFKVLEFSYDN